jgi:hypothetical protein
MNRLDADLIAAHETGDLHRLARLYARAADEASDENAAAFYLTHAYVFALDAGLDTAPQLRDRLILMGREEPL